MAPMKPRNFPARKLARQLRAGGVAESALPLAMAKARSVRTKKHGTKAQRMAAFRRS
jgi:hypothetical protein